MSEYPMTLDELLAACKEASDLGEPIELDPLTAQAMVEDSINLSTVIERMALMLGKDPDVVNVHNMLDEVRAIVADFVALKAQVQTVLNLREAYSAACFRMREGHVSIAEESESAGAVFLRLEAAVEQLASLIERLEPKRSPVLEIAEVNHE